MKKLAILIIAIITTSCVQEQHLKTVQVKIDMRGVEDVKSIGVKGNFTNPRWKVEVPLTDEDKDGIYETSLSQKTAVSGIEFKFVKNGEIYELKGKPNRVLRFEYKPENIIYATKFNDIESVVIQRE
ncbi:hypothetical protein [Tenacibaculum sp. 190524A05c]|uniref:hypothetical protein n=1 Tax=Tenacibaculum platacis TaxID=3137852 RepID=UPI0032B2B606